MAAKVYLSIVLCEVERHEMKGRLRENMKQDRDVERNASRFLSFSAPATRWFIDIPDAIVMIEEFTSVWISRRSGLRHAYERIDLETSWNSVTDDLAPLKRAVERTVRPPGEPGAQIPAADVHSPAGLNDFAAD